MRYFITFACYGVHLHGDESGSVDRNHNVPGGRLAEANPERVAVMLRQMDQALYELDRERRMAVVQAIREVSVHRNWSLLAAHVRSNHVHVVVEADVQPDRVMNSFKSYASRTLNRLGIDEPERKRWARHGKHALVMER
jgi:transposase IS200 family protein